MAPEQTTRFEWTGTNLGSITLTNPATGRSYRAGLNLDDRFLFVHADDLAWAQGIRQLRPAPDPDASEPAATADDDDAAAAPDAAATADDDDAPQPKPKRQKAAP